jgi:hypothetical protein
VIPAVADRAQRLVEGVLRARLAEERILNGLQLVEPGGKQVDAVASSRDDGALHRSGSLPVENIGQRDLGWIGSRVLGQLRCHVALWIGVHHQDPLSAGRHGMSASHCHQRLPDATLEIGEDIYRHSHPSLPLPVQRLYLLM